MHGCKTVTLRTRPLKGRMMSFYLDYYPGYRDKETMKVIRHESLGIYVYANPRNKREQSKFFIYRFFCHLITLSNSDYPSISLTRQHFQEALHSQHHLSERS